MAFKVGDRVIIKKLDEMIREYGENEFGGANTIRVFTIAMEYFCGKKATIRGFYKELVDLLFDEEDSNCFVNSKYYTFDAQMIRPIISKPQEAEIEIKELVNKINNNFKKERKN